MAKIVTFGEIMMRLATPGHLRFAQTPSLEVTFGGGESNVAASLARFGHDAAFVTRLPKNDWGDRATATLRGLGVDVSRIVTGDGRMGVYFLESGAGPRASRGDLRPGRQCDQPDSGGRGRLGPGVRGRGLVSLDGHHARAGRGGRRRRRCARPARRPRPPAPR